LFATREACNVEEDMKARGLTKGLAGKRVVVQGLGNVGYHIAHFLEAEGALIVGTAESEGAIHDPKGLQVDRVVQHRLESKAIRDYPGAQNLPSSAAALEPQCDT